MSVDGTPISRADMARIQAEEELHAKQQRRAVRLVAMTATDADDCRELLSMLGLDDAVVAAARTELAGATSQTPQTKQSRKRRAA